MAVEQGEGLVSFALYKELLRALAHAGEAQRALDLLRDYEDKLQGRKVNHSSILDWWHMHTCTGRADREVHLRCPVLSTIHCSRCLTDPPRSLGRSHRCISCATTQ